MSDKKLTEEEEEKIIDDGIDAIGDRLMAAGKTPLGIVTVVIYSEEEVYLTVSVEEGATQAAREAGVDEKVVGSMLNHVAGDRLIDWAHESGVCVDGLTGPARKQVPQRKQGRPTHH